MGLVLSVVVLAALVGLARGGTPAALAAVRPQGVVLLGVAVLWQVLAALTDGWLAGLLVSASALLAAVVLLRNRDLPGLPLLGLGLVLNAVVVVANGAMPVSLHAAARAGVESRALLEDRDPGHEPAGDGTRFSWLGDVVPVASPLHREVVSPGDVCVAAGLGWFVVVGFGQRRVRGRRGASSARPPA